MSTWVVATLTAASPPLPSQGAPVVLWEALHEAAEALELYDLEGVPGGGAIVAGALTSEDFDATRMYLARLDDDGMLGWEKVLESETAAWIADVEVLADGDLAVAGSHLARTDAAGAPRWTRALPAFALCLRATRDGGFILAGRSEWQLFAHRTDALGFQTWSRLWPRFGRSTHYRDEAGSIVEAADGSLLLAGTVWIGGDEDGGYRALATRLDAAGHTVWEKPLLSVELGYETGANAIMETPDGGALVAGVTWRFQLENNSDMFLARLDGEGEPLWMRSHDRGKYDRVVRARLASDGGLTLLASDSPPFRMLFLRADPAGELLWEWQLPYEIPRALAAVEGGWLIGSDPSGASSQGSRLRWQATRFGPEGEARFQRANVNGDRTVDLSDGISILEVLFVNGTPPVCPDALDADDSGEVDISDAIRLFGHLFLGAPPPPAPFASCGFDASGDALDCAGTAPCTG